MIVELIRYELPEVTVQPFLSAYRTSLPHLLADPHCVEAEVLHGVDEPTRVVIRIVWTSIEGHVEHFTNGPHFASFISPLRPYLKHIVEIAHYQPVDLQSS